MTGFPTANFSDSERGLFSPVEIQQLMRIEFERVAKPARGHQDIACDFIFSEHCFGSLSLRFERAVTRATR